MDVYRAEYIWIDGTSPTPKLRSKAKIVNVGEEPPIWGFDGSSPWGCLGLCLEARLYLSGLDTERE